MSVHAYLDLRRCWHRQHGIWAVPQLRVECPWFWKRKRPRFPGRLCFIAAYSEPSSITLRWCLFIDSNLGEILQNQINQCFVLQRREWLSTTGFYQAYSHMDKAWQSHILGFRKSQKGHQHQQSELQVMNCKKCERSLSQSMPMVMVPSPKRIADGAGADGKPGWGCNSTPPLTVRWLSSYWS